MLQNFETNKWKKIILYQTTQHTTILDYFFPIFFSKQISKSMQL